MIKNVLLDDPIPDLLLEFDFKNISTKEYYYIVQTIRHSSSLLNDDLVHISKEMVERVKNDTFHGIDKNMPSATSDNITIINFGMGSPNAATIMDLLSAIRPKAVLFLGKCGGLKKRIDISTISFC